MRFKVGDLVKYVEGDFALYNKGFEIGESYVVFASSDRGITGLYVMSLRGEKARVVTLDGNFSTSHGFCFIKIDEVPILPMGVQHVQSW